jgi:hypothetical protein
VQTVPVRLHRVACTFSQGLSEQRMFVNGLGRAGRDHGVQY